MNNSDLPVTPASGTQTTTQNPQSAGGSDGSGASASSVQPGTTSRLLDTTTGGVPLRGQALPTIALAPSSTSVVAQPLPPSQPPNPLAIGFSVLFFIVAVVVLISIFLPTKNTTK